MNINKEDIKSLVLFLTFIGFLATMIYAGWVADRRNDILNSKINRELETTKEQLNTYQHKYRKLRKQHDLLKTYMETNLDQSKLKFYKELEKH